MNIAPCTYASKARHAARHIVARRAMRFFGEMCVTIQQINTTVTLSRESSIYREICNTVRCFEDACTKLEKLEKSRAKKRTPRGQSRYDDDLKSAQFFRRWNGWEVVKHLRPAAAQGIKNERDATEDMVPLAIGEIAQVCCRIMARPMSLSN